jgi:hypothetical protein
MRIGRRIAIVAGTAAVAVLTTPSLAHGLAISAPTSVTLGSAPTSASSLSGQLGTITVTDSGTLFLLPSFVAAVSSTVFTTGSGSPSETIGTSSVFYWSGPATASSGLQTPVPGQLLAANMQSLSVSRTAFRSTGLVLSISTSWNPTIVIDIPDAAVAGTYSGTITHSVA